jgi:hypothetical protein
VKWKGYPTSQATWEPEAHLAHLPEELNKFRNAISTISIKPKSKPVRKSKKVRWSNTQILSSYLSARHSKRKAIVIEDDSEEEQVALEAYGTPRSRNSEKRTLVERV